MNSPQPQLEGSRRAFIQASTVGALATFSGCSEWFRSSTPTELWRFETYDLFLTSPAVRNGTVFVGSDDYRVYALDAADGSKQWQFEPTQGTGGVRLHDSRLLFGTHDGNVYSLAAADGSEQWRRKLGGSVTARPAVADNTIVVNARNYVIYGLSATDGRVLWRHDLEKPSHLSEADRELLGDCPADPVVVDGLVVCGSYDRQLRALDVETGELEWSVEMDGLAYATPAVADGVVYAGAPEGSFYSFSAATGERRWRQGFSAGSVVRAPAAADGRVYVGIWSENDEAKVAALDAATGEQQWTHRVLAYSGLTLADDALVFGSNDGYVYSVSTAGERNWRFKASERTRGAPTVQDGRVYFGSGTDMYAIEPE